MNNRILPNTNKSFRCSFSQLSYEEVKDLLEMYNCDIIVGGRNIIGDFLIVPDNYDFTMKVKHAKEQSKPIIKVSSLDEFIELNYY